MNIIFLFLFRLVGWGCRIHQPHLCRGVNPPYKCPEYDTKQYVEVSVMLELWGMQNTPSLPSFPGPLRPGVVAPDRVLSMGQIELNHSFENLLFLHLNCIFMLN